MSTTPSRTWKPTTVYCARREGGTLVIDTARVKSWGPEWAVLTERKRAWRHAARVETRECFLTPEAAFDDEYARMRNEARDLRESADALDEQVKRADDTRATVVAAAKALTPAPN